MPYIQQDKREALRYGDEIPKTTGELNFTLTSLIKQYITYNSLSYQSINDVIGALESAKLEFYRRIAVPYENSKIALNGDVYE